MATIAADRACGGAPASGRYLGRRKEGARPADDRRDGQDVAFVDCRGGKMRRGLSSLCCTCRALSGRRTGEDRSGGELPTLLAAWSSARRHAVEFSFLASLSICRTRAHGGQYS